MRLLLDENVPKKLKQDLVAFHDVFTVREMRRDGNEDEDVLQFLVNFNMDALITCDKNLRFQQNLTKYSTPVLVLDTYTNAYPVLKAIIPALLATLEQPLESGATVIRI
ncbi:DUF5615 family PIN-like protein [Spirosoma endbachense]|uniref:DUF5615 domain-containing protein n=1 Tax=Spirosoma endbachense TaxID=2666025 RepID=A0A6P1VXR2_9BACT|nr:DUF5615 family PIN-like protein [Spirosoma endbachense]QHV97108.1 hypothetical protein GJR95_19775 [Spirosoma endbachense]